MASKWTNLLGGSLAVLLVMGGVASAQIDGDKKPSTLAMEVEALEAEVANLSGEEKIEHSVEKLEEMKGVLDSTNVLVEKVRTEEQDIIKLNCVNEKLVAVKGFVKVSEQSFGNLKTAVSTDDKEASNHHYTLIAIAGQKVSVLGEEARVCAGETLLYAGDVQVEGTVDPDIADFDPIEIDDDLYDYMVATGRLPELTVFR